MVFPRVVALRPAMMRQIGALLLVAVLGSCGPGSVATLPPAATPPAGATSAPIPGDLAAFAAGVCMDAYERCTEGVLTMAAVASGRLVAICNYDDGSGDVVLVDSETAGESECSGGGAIPGSRVVRVVRLP